MVTMYLHSLSYDGCQRHVVRLFIPQVFTSIAQFVISHNFILEDRVL